MNRITLLLTTIILCAIMIAHNASAQCERLIFNQTNWEGNGWCYNVNQGAWFPEISGDEASFVTSDFCWGQVRTRVNIARGDEVSIQIRPQLASGGVNFDAVFLGFGDGWMLYQGDFAGIWFYNGNVEIVRRRANLNYHEVISTIGNYVAGQWYDISLKMDDDNHLYVNGSFVGTVTLDLFPADCRYIIAVANSTDGFNARNVGLSAGDEGLIANFSPNPQYAYWAFALNPMIDTIFLSNFTCGQTASDVVSNTLLVNGVVEPIGHDIIIGKNGFDGEVLVVFFPLPDFMDTYPTLYDTTMQIYTITGQFANGAAFAAEGEVSIIGRKSHSSHKEFIMMTTENELNMPSTISLLPNCPNPFNPTTEIRFSLPRACRVSLDIFNIAGQKVTTLADGTLEAGYHTVVWNGRDNGGMPVASGIYLYRLQAAEFMETRKMMLLK